MLRILLITLALLGGTASPVAAQDRLALVIGNDGYQAVPALRKAVSDANAVAAALAAQDFEVFGVIDADRRTMNRQVSQFTARLEPGDTALLFFAGHGVEIDGENYLLPVDIITPAAGGEDFIKAESIALSSLLDRIRATGAKVTIAIIDACRDNPFASTTGRSIGGTRGLGRIAAPEGTFVIYSAGAGQMALDELVENEPQANSVFTRTLLPKLARPGLELRDLIKEVRLEVRNTARQVNHAQFPAYYDELLGEFYFAGATPAEITPQPPPGYDLAGRWDVRASCPMFIKTTGVLTIERVSDNRFTGHFTDSLDQQATSDIRLDGRNIETTDDFSWVITTGKLRLAPDGQSATGSTSAFCDIVWTRVG